MSALLLAGIDEAGRGPLAGPVVAAAVILDPQRPLAGLADSKTLSAARRETLAQLIRAQALAFGIGVSEADEIDRVNILQATFLAMQRAFAALALVPDKALIDGNRCPLLPCPTEAIIKGDALIPAISAASILAKVERDQRMLELHSRYPHYGFDQHKGYPTAAHRAALRTHGASPIHRLSFAPVRAVLKEHAP